ncbi:MAG: adenylate/guanylate cyclase domain-containing protein [Cyanobacteria bacterium P01_F01_bin.3]
MNTPMHPQIQRTLAAIVVTDAVGFSKRMSQDEDKALAMINRDIQLIEELCEFFEGKILKTVGDGVLMYFVSAVQAAACAVEMQKTFIGFSKTDQKGEHFTHRVGVHLGDIFFNQTDMMGTGVNIAARLESEAKPGAICMSQVVYDVVKSRLELDADYVGELLLKNISEGVAAYNVWPKGMRPKQEREDTTEAVSPLTITPLNAALKKLSAHPNSRRIKKLLYGTHQAYWENDSTILEGIALKMLLESLTDRNTTLEECRHSLYQIVATLNRQEEYTQVANIIVDSLKDFYEELTGGTFRTKDTAETDDAELLENPMIAFFKDIAGRLEQTADPIRTKKMLYCLCYDSWENDNHHIEKMSTILLVEGVYNRITSIQELRERLKIILQRLNRKAKYAPIANAIFKECQVLYPDVSNPEIDSQISMPGTAGVDDSPSENTRINMRKKADKHWSGPKPAAQPPKVVPRPPNAVVQPPILGSVRVESAVIH